MYNDRKSEHKTKQTKLSIQIHRPPANRTTSSTSPCKFRVSIAHPMNETMVVHLSPMTGGQLLCCFTIFNHFIADTTFPSDKSETTV